MLVLFICYLNKLCIKVTYIKQQRGVVTKKHGLEVENQYLQIHVQHRLQFANDISRSHFGLIVKTFAILVELDGPH